MKSFQTGGSGSSWRFNWRGLKSAYGELLSSVSEGSVDIPSLFLSGEHSSYLQASDQQGVLERFTAAEFATIADAGHWLHAENPQACLDQIQRFLGKVL